MDNPKGLLRHLRDNKKLVVALGSLLCGVGVLVALVFFLYKLKQRILDESDVSKTDAPAEDEQGEGEK